MMTAHAFSPVPLILLAAFLVVNILVVRTQLGVKTYDEFATANRAVGFVGVALAIYTTWYVGAVFTAWAGFAVGLRGRTRTCPCSAGRRSSSPAGWATSCGRGS